MKNVTLTYFDIPTSRGEECRLALTVAGVEFTDERLRGAAWTERKPHTPFGALPVLTAQDHPPVAQSNAILTLIGRLHGLHPVEPWAAAREEALMAWVEDLRHRMGPIARIKDEAEKKRQREEAAAGYLPEWAAAVERQLGAGPFVAGADLHVVDIKLFVVLDPYRKGAIDHVPATVFDGAPKLLRLHQAVSDHPAIRKWYGR